MPLDARKVAHIAANRSRIASGRSETVVLVTASAGLVGYRALAGCLWHDAGAVPAGVTDRAGEVTRAAWDALLVLPDAATVPDDLRCIARTATASAGGVAAASCYLVLDRHRAGIGTSASGGGLAAGDRWLLKLRLIR